MSITDMLHYLPSKMKIVLGLKFVKNKGFKLRTPALRGSKVLPSGGLLSQVPKHTQSTITNTSIFIKKFGRHSKEINFQKRVLVHPFIKKKI